MPNNQELHLQQTQMLSHQDFRSAQAIPSPQTRASQLHVSAEMTFQSTKSRFLCAFRVWKPYFRASQAQNLHFCARSEGQVASGSVKVTFLQFTTHANVPQRCLEQGFVRAVICRNAAPGQATDISSIQHLHPGQATASFGGDTKVA